MTARKFTKMSMMAIATKAAKDKEDLDAFEAEAAKHVERLLEVAERLVHACEMESGERAKLTAELESVRKELGL